MSQITSLYVHKILSQVSAGVETADLVKGLGMAVGVAVDPKQMVSSTDFYDFFANLVARDPDGLSLPLRIGATMRSDDYGAFGLAWKTAPSLRGSYARSQRYGHVLGSAETYTLEQSNDGWFFSLDKAGDGRLGMLLSNEASMAAVDVISREVTTASFAPLAVYFKHAARGDVSTYETHFGCPVLFGSPRDALLVSEDTLDAPNRLGDETVVSFFDRHLEQELASVASDDGLEQRVRRAVARSAQRRGTDAVIDRIGVGDWESDAAKTPVGQRSLLPKRRGHRAPGSCPAAAAGNGLQPGRDRVPDGLLGAKRLHPRLQALGRSDAALLSPGTDVARTLTIVVIGQ
jgi:hypothetical protein